MREVDGSTRARVLAAAIECIGEEGFYRASSNRIAERAGLTWGVIQYHFGTREQLLLAAVIDTNDRLMDALGEASIRGGSLQERLEQLSDVVWANYSNPRFLVNLQIMLNLARDPTSKAQTVEALEGLAARGAREWGRLVDDALGANSLRADEKSAVFEILRGLAIGHQVSAALAVRSGTRRQVAAGRRAALEAVTHLVERHAVDPGGAPHAEKAARGPLRG